MSSESGKRTGGCLCGTVRYEAELQSTDAHACHCSICQKWAGGPAIGLHCVKTPDITGAENVGWYKSSKWGERGFCKTCGSKLFFRLDPSYGDIFSISVASLDNSKDVKITKHIYIESKPDYYDFADDAPRLTGEEFLAQLKDQ